MKSLSALMSVYNGENFIDAAIQSVLNDNTKNDKMKIIHILSGKANPNTLNGVNRVVDALASEQTILGHDVTVYGVASNLEKRHHPNYKYKLFLDSKNSFKYPKELWHEICKSADSNTIFHFHSVFIPWFFPLIKKLRKNNFNRIVLAPHGGYTNSTVNKSLKKKLFFRFYDSKIIKKVSIIHIIGKNSELCDLIFPYINQYKILPNGNYYENRPINFDRQNLIFGYMGRLQCDHKGLDLLIEAFNLYKREGGKGLLYFVGNGPDEQKLKNLSNKYDLHKYVKFLGSLFDSAKSDFLDNCTGFIHTSRWEGMPMAILEAMAHGIPLIITRETNLDEYVESKGAGLIISPNTIENIVLRLKEFEFLYENNREKYRQMCIQSQQLIKEDLNWKNIAKKTIEELYKFED
jgi:glycosyltransferase involved in cell wall biosynthesis